MMRLGVFGGAFDPPHRAHVALAQAAVSQLKLDELRVFPTGQAWHRTQPLSTPAHRLAMAAIAFSGLPHTVIDDRELRRPGPTYTIDTLRELKAEQPDSQLFLVMGEDQATSLTRWHEWGAVTDLAIICMASRSLAQVQKESSPAAALPERAKLHLLELPDMPESATEVRERAAAGEDIAHLVPPGIASYIDLHHLYRRT